MHAFGILLQTRTFYKYQFKYVTNQMPLLLFHCGGTQIYSAPLNPVIHLVLDLLIIILPSHQEVRFAPATPRTQQATHVPAPVTQPSSGTQGSVGEIQPLIPLTLPPVLNVLVSALWPIPLAALAKAEGLFRSIFFPAASRSESSRDHGVGSAPQHSPPLGSLASSPDMAVYTLAILCSLMDIQLKRGFQSRELTGTC